MEPPARGIIFDFDGLIIDTETAVYEGWRELYSRFGFDLPLEEYVQCVGSTREVRYDPARELDLLVGEELDWDALHPDKDARIRRLLDNADTLPGVRDLLMQAREHGVPCAIASSSTHWWVDGWLERLGLVLHFEVIRCRDDVDRPKPAPDLFLAAAHGLGLGAGEVVVLEDSENGLRGAAAAGMRCVVVPNQITRVSSFDGAWRRLDSLAEVTLPELHVFPAGTGSRDVDPTPAP